MKNLNLILSCFWLLLGLALLAWPKLNPQPDGPDWTILNTGIPAGWIAIVLGVYNLVRWWSIRSRAALRRADEEGFLRRQPRPSHRPPQEPDPTFDFTKPSAGPEDQPSPP
jgi:hypothetical protein